MERARRRGRQHDRRAPRNGRRARNRHGVAPRQRPGRGPVRRGRPAWSPASRPSRLLRERGIRPRPAPCGSSLRRRGGRALRPGLPREPLRRGSDHRGRHTHRLTDTDGVSVADAMRSVGLDPARSADGVWRQEDWAGFIELHVEQGAVLEARGEPDRRRRSGVRQHPIRAAVRGPRVAQRQHPDVAPRGRDGGGRGMHRRGRPTRPGATPPTARATTVGRRRGAARQHHHDPRLGPRLRRRRDVDSDRSGRRRSSSWPAPRRRAGRRGVEGHRPPVGGRLPRRSPDLDAGRVDPHVQASRAAPTG